MEHLNKSDFILFLDSPMHLFAKNNVHLDIKIPSIYDRFLMEQGQKIERLAEKHLIDKFKGEEVFSQQTYKTDNFLTRPDFVVKNSSTGLYDLYEIKSSSSIKKEHNYDITFQNLVCSECIPIGNSYIVHINKNFVKKGSVDFSTFFQITNVNEIVEKYKSEVRSRMIEALEISHLKDQNLIEGCLKPKLCISLDLCHPDLPDHSIYEVSRIGKKAKLLRDEGILEIKDIPPDFKLSSRQSIQVKSVKENEVQINPVGIQKTLDELEYPIYFLDYETFNPAIPYFDGYSPYQQITFQFSLHVLAAKGETLQHFEYIHDNFSDPTFDITDRLKQFIGDVGSIVV